MKEEQKDQVTNETNKAVYEDSTTEQQNDAAIRRHAEKVAKGETNQYVDCDGEGGWC